MSTFRKIKIIYSIPTCLLVLIAIWLWWTATHKVSNANQAMVSGQYQLASEFFNVEAQKGNPAAQNALANLYYLGLGVGQDFEQASQLYFAAARQNLAVAQLNLANLYKQGLGVKQNPMRAFAWYRMSDINGNPMAEVYMSQIAIEYTIGPLQIDTANRKWARLEALVEEGL